MKENKLLKRLLSVVFTLGMVIAFLPGAAITAHAEDGPLVGTVIKNGDSFTFEKDTCVLVLRLPGETMYQTFSASETLSLTSSPSFDDNKNQWVFKYPSVIYPDTSLYEIRIQGEKTKKPDGIQFVSGDGSGGNPYIPGLYFEPEPTPTPPAPTPTPTIASDEKDEPAPKPEPKQDQTLLTGYIVNGKDAAGNDTYANFSQENVWKVVKISSDANSVTYDITPQWETYGSVRIGIPAPGFADGPVLVDHYKNGKLIATYSGWVTSEWCEFDNPDGFSRFVIRKQGTTAQTPRRGYVPDTGVR